MSRLLLYHDFASPFCRLAVPVAAEAARRTGLALRAVPFELRPPPTPLPRPGGVDEEEMEAARATAAAWGLELGEPGGVPRTRKAHEAVAYAREREQELPMLEGLYDALWRRGLDISRVDVLTEVGEAVGLDRDAMHVALGVDTFEKEVVREQRAAASAGLTGVPAVQVGDVLAVGLLPIDELVAWIEENR